MLQFQRFALKYMAVKYLNSKYVTLLYILHLLVIIEKINEKNDAIENSILLTYFSQVFYDMIYYSYF